ncbi:MAG: Asp-tRNA(Asn)/Glu-tRNA(Gln) amidotransferase subunit GatC [Holosporales bacterium]|jgi:aspartyl/glutamyl-tRNA(Asn/Gln) amidotransferase C subunit|nr:Asp-tRNA(Asn)/Glu-tRNA(Gln) amidotransferase subunit GatC [Holosporales bacterium]
MLTDKELEKICKLAKLKIEDDKKDVFLEKLNGSFAWIDQLTKIDVSTIEVNNFSEADKTPERKDIQDISNTKEELLTNTKNKKFDMFCVPKVIE